jgi:hypothetical protein
MKRETTFDRRIRELTAQAIVESLAEIAIIFHSKWGDHGK